MKAAIIAIGRELITGDVLDTNSRFIAEACRDAGISVRRIALVDDIEDEIVFELLNASAQMDLVFTTGGLGPTSDDKTRQAVARAVGEELVQNEQSLGRLSAYAKKRNRPLNENNLRQTYFPRSAGILVNDWGTADAFVTPVATIAAAKAAKSTSSSPEEAPACRIVSLPGVPDELHNLIEKRVIPWLREHFILPPPKKNISLRCFGLTEAHIGQTIEALSLPEGLEIAYRPQFPEILLKITASGNAGDENSANALIQAEAEIVSALGPEFVFSRSEHESLPETVGNLLRERGMTLASVESCSGGLLAHRLVSIPGASDFFLASLVTYSNSAKSEFAGVSAAVLDAHGAVSEQTAEALARGARERTRADFGLSITGIAGPDGGTDEKPVGTVWIGLASAASVEAHRYQLPWERSRVREYSVSLALDLLRRRLLDYSLRWNFPQPNGGAKQ